MAAFGRLPLFEALDRAEAATFDVLDDSYDVHAAALQEIWAAHQQALPPCAVAPVMATKSVFAQGAQASPSLLVHVLRCTALAAWAAHFAARNFTALGDADGATAQTARMRAHTRAGLKILKRALVHMGVRVASRRAAAELLLEGWW